MANTTYDTIKNMKPAPWSRSTVADGNALNQNFLEPTHQKDLALATAIDQVKNTVDGYNETINNISNVADAAKTLASNAISAANEAQDDVEALQTTVTEMTEAVSAHGESIETLGNNFNTLSAAVAGEAEAINNLQNNKQDKIYVDANTISGNGTSDSPYTVIGGNQKELEFVDSTTVTVHKDEQDDKIIYSFSAAGGGGGGTSYDYAWIPSVAQNGDISWTWDEYTAAPETQNIKGPQGQQGIQGPAGPQGPSGASGAKGEDGFSPTVTTAGIEPTIEHPQGGTSVTITDKTGPNQFNVWNGINGEGASLSAGSGINIDNNSINVKLGKNLKFDTYRNVTTEDNISAFSFHAGEYNNQYTIVNKNGVESHFTSSPDLHLMTLTTHGLNNATTGANRSITADYDLNHLFFKSCDNNGTYSGDYSQVEIKVLQAEQPAETQHRSSIALTDYYGGVEHVGLITVEKIAQWDQGGGFTGVTTAGSISGDGLTNPLGLKTSAEQALAAVGGKLSSPTLTADTYYVLHCDDNNALQWEDFDTYLRDTVEGITEDMGTLYEDAMNPENGLSAYFDENSYAYHFGIDTTNMNSDRLYGFTTNGWSEIDNWFMNRFQFENGVSGVPDMTNYKMLIGLSGNYLPTSGGTVSGQLEVHGGSNFDQQFIKLTREGNSCGARLGLGSDTTNGTLALKTFNAQGQNTVQVNIKHSTNNNELIQVQKDGNTVGTLIPAVVHQGSYTPTSDDGILHIVLES